MDLRAALGLRRSCLVIVFGSGSGSLAQKTCRHARAIHDLATVVEPAGWTRAVGHNGRVA